MPSAETVSVGCKMPNGIILHVHRVEEEHEVVLGSEKATRLVKKYHREGEGVRLYGPAIPRGQSAVYQKFGGYAITTNVPKAFMDRWMAEYKDSDLVRNGMIIVQAASRDIVAEARDKAEIRSGFEPLNVERDAKGKPVDSRIKSLARAKADIVSGVEKFDKRS